MRITAERALAGIAHMLKDKVTPALDDGFAQEATRLGTLVLTITANGIDDAASVRVWENAGIRTLLGRAQTLGLADPDLAARLVEASRSTDPGLRLSTLDVETGRLRGLLVQLHEAVEDLPGDDARTMEHAIWAFLREVETARTPRS